MRASVSLPALPAQAKTAPPAGADADADALDALDAALLLPPRADYAARFRAQSRSALVRCDVGALLARFEDAAIAPTAQRHARAADAPPASTSSSSVPASSASPTSAAAPVALQPALNAGASRRRMATMIAAAPAVTTSPKAAARSAASRLGPAALLPARVLFDDARWTRGARCDYCQRAGGELECATCDVVAHAPCFLADFGARARKQKAAFVAPTRFSWLCRHCQCALQAEYDARAAAARARQLAQRRTALGRAVTAYLRMASDARVFQRKKRAAVRIQAAARGRLARWRFARMQRTRVRPIALEALRISGRVATAAGESCYGLSCSVVGGTMGTTGGVVTTGTTGVVTAGTMDPGGDERLVTEEMRLANGFSCNPLLYVTVSDGEDDALQLFCFETSMRKGLAATGVAGGAAAVDVAWPERLFVPGMDGNASVTFTLLSKNGPNHFFLGQAVLRLLDTDDATWRDGANLELQLRPRVEIPPKTAQKQPLRLAHPVSASSSSTSSSLGGSWAGDMHNAIDEDDERRPLLRLTVALRPLRDAQSHCGYMGLKTALEGFHANPRWCVLADGVLRVYRHYGVTVASETVDMARAIDVRLERGHCSLSAAGSGHKRGPPAPRRAHDERDKRERRAPNCVVIQHDSRSFVFECEHGEAARAWHKKLQAAQRQATGSIIGGGGGATLAAVVESATRPA